MDRHICFWDIRGRLEEGIYAEWCGLGAALNTYTGSSNQADWSLSAFGVGEGGKRSERGGQQWSLVA